MAVSAPTVDEVRGVVKTSLDDDDLGALIDDATLLVTDCVSSLDSDRQKAIVKYVTAHLVTVTGGETGVASVSRRKLGDAEKTYVRGKVGSGLSETSYGRQVMALDPSGCVAGLWKERMVMEVL